MRLGDDVTILRPGLDEYGQPLRSFDDATPHATKAFIIGRPGKKAFFAVGTDVKPGDRLLWGAEKYDVVNPTTVRSPSRDVLVVAGLTRVEA